MIIVDSREKKWLHIEDYFRRHSVEYFVKKLDVGDYMNTNNEKLIIDRKRNLDECCTNLCSNDNTRFWKEVRRAKREGIKLIVLIEHSSDYKSIKDVVNWKSKYARITGRKLAEEMYRVHIAYGVEWLFCSKRSTGKRIVEILDKGL